MRAIVDGDLSDILESLEVTVVASGLLGTEGPVWHPDGYLLFVDLKQSKLLKWTPGQGLTTVREPNHEGNGLTLDPENRVLMCEAGNRRVVRMEKDGTWTTIVDNWQGRKLNRPNDIIRRSDGTIYFSDPNTTLAKSDRELDGSVVWRLSPDGRLEIGSRDNGFPNGLALSPDESVLYVSNSFQDEHCFDERKAADICAHRYLCAYDVAKDGSLSNFRKITDMTSNHDNVPDGLKVDRNGTVFCTGSGALWVLDPKGGVLGKIRTPEPGRNCAFGDADMKTLYITTLTEVYSLRMKTPGIGPAS